MGVRVEAELLQLRSQAELGIENKEINLVPKLRLGTDGKIDLGVRVEAELLQLRSQAELRIENTG
ncbi:MAG: hypothetical protein NTX44_09795 [Ignavibacteriales bacterium]|nr:hypothetical protein [Ignavibacteriales bacterium]